MKLEIKKEDLSFEKALKELREDPTLCLSRKDWNDRHKLNGERFIGFDPESENRTRENLITAGGLSGFILTDNGDVLEEYFELNYESICADDWQTWQEKALNNYVLDKDKLNLNEALNRLLLRREVYIRRSEWYRSDSQMECIFFDKGPNEQTKIIRSIKIFADSRVKYGPEYVLKETDLLINDWEVWRKREC